MASTFPMSESYTYLCRCEPQRHLQNLERMRHLIVPGVGIEATTTERNSEYQFIFQQNLRKGDQLLALSVER